MRYFIPFLLVLFHLGAISQELNGVWKGMLTQRDGGCFPVYFLEIQIREEGIRLQGLSYDFHDTTRFVKHAFSGRYNAQTRRMVLTETRMLSVRIPFDCVACIKTYELVYSKEGEREVLRGSWKGVDAERGAPCPPGEITLYRNPEPVFPPEDFFETDSLTAIRLRTPESIRLTELVTTVELKHPKLEVLLYDNAEIDDDTVSLTVNNQLIAHRQRLSGKALRYELTLHPGKIYDMVMRAENLGSIPPNTALMIVKSGEERFEVRLSSSEEKSAVVRFRYVKN